MNVLDQEMVKTIIRPLQYKDLDEIAQILGQTEETSDLLTLAEQVQQIHKWYGMLKFLTFFPNPWQNYFRVYIAEYSQKVAGMIQVAPLNISRSTWRVKQVLASSSQTKTDLSFLETGSQLLRYCFETLWEARTWILEVNVQHTDTLALYRQNGFQPIAQMTYWSLPNASLSVLAQHSSELPNLLPVGNADAQLLYQLDCVSMPPLLRQVFDRHVQDFLKDVLSKTVYEIKQWWTGQQIREAYVFEPQRKAAIAYFKLHICRDGKRPHQVELTVHPAYTWLYGQILARLAQITQSYPPQSLELVSADYQPEREECLERLEAQRIEHTLLMSRSVWHKLREVKQEGLQLSDVLQGFKPVARSPIPTRISSFSQTTSIAIIEKTDNPPNNNSGDSSDPPSNGHHA